MILKKKSKKEVILWDQCVTKQLTLYSKHKYILEASEMYNNHCKAIR